MKEIKKCPFCGYLGELTWLCTVVYWDKKLNRHRVDCMYCKHRGPEKLTRWGAIRAWNKMTSVVEIKEIMRSAQ